jgi:alpha/beta superfamily hydrolase
MCLRVERFDAGDSGGSFSRGAGAHVDVGAMLREAGDRVVASVVW